MTFELTTGEGGVTTGGGTTGVTLDATTTGGGEGDTFDATTTGGGVGVTFETTTTGGVTFEGITFEPDAFIAANPSASRISLSPQKR